jgi:RecB family exonuclease
MKRFSYSALESFNICPQQYKFAAIDKVEIPKRVSADAYLGASVHRCLSILYKHGADGILYPLDKILEVYEAEWEKPKKEHLVAGSEHYTIDDYIRLGREMLERYYEKYKPFKEGTLIGSEMRTSFELPGTNFRFSAVLDLIIKKDDGTIEIRDFKTGQRMPSVKERGFYYQMGLYQLALKALHPQYKDIELTQYFLRKDELIKRKLTDDELEQITEEYRNAVLEIKNAIRLNDFPTKEGGHCRYCEFFNICPAKRHGQMLNGGKAFEDLEEREKIQKMKEMATRFIEKKNEAKEVENEIEALKGDLIQLAKDTGLSAFEGDGGKVKVALKQGEKFVTKSEDAEAFAELAAIARELGLDEFMTLDANALYKEGVAKERLTEEQMNRLKDFLRIREESRISVSKLNKDEEVEGAD